MMKVCVFGASGYVGASVYKQLEKCPDVDVVGTYLTKPVMLDGLYKLNVNEPESFSQFYKDENPDVVIWSVMSGPEEYELLEKGFMHLLSHITPGTKLVYLSSDLVFSDGNGPYEETDYISALPEDHLYHHYTNAKVKAERFIDNELSNYVLLRTGPVYGENVIGKLDEYTDKLSYRLRSGKEVGFRDDLIRTFVSVEELADTVVKMTLNDMTGIYHVGGEESMSFYSFMQQEANRLGFNSDRVTKKSEYEAPDKEIPKNTSLDTKKIKNICNLMTCETS